MTASENPTRFPLVSKTVDTTGITSRIRDIAQTIKEKPDIQLVEVISPNAGYLSINVRELGTTTTYPAVLVGFDGACTPLPGTFVWVMTASPGSMPFVIGEVQPILPRCKVFLNNPIPAAPNAITGTLIGFDGNWTEEYKHNVTHSAVTNNTRLTILEDGLYHLDPCLSFAAGSGEAAVIVQRNGTTLKSKIRPLSGLWGVTVDAAMPVGLLAGDYIEMRYYHNNAGNINLIQGQGNSYLEVRKLADVG